MAASAMAGAQTPVPGGSNLPALINGNQTDLSLEGDVVWNSALTGALVRDFTINGNNRTIDVRANISMISYLLRDAKITINDAKVISTDTTAGTHLISFGTGNYTSDLNLEGTTFDNYHSTLAVGGGIIYAYGDNHKITINGGDRGVTFSNNRAQSESGGAVTVYFSDLTFAGKVTFDSNWTGNYGGAVAVYEADNRLTFNGETTFTKNHSVVFGGALDLWGGNNTEVTFNGRTVFDGNYVRYQTAVDGQSPPHVTDQNPRGGAINIGYVGLGKTSITFNDEVVFTGNRVISTDASKTAMGGAISVFGNNLAKNYQIIFNDAAVFDGNYAVSAGGRGDGGAIFYDSRAALLSLTSGTKFLNNSASRYGGAIYLQSGTIQLNAAVDDIIFQGNRQGVSIDANYAPTAGSGKPNAIYLGTGGNLDFVASSGHTIHMHDPIASAAGSSVIITKTGGGEVIFYGDNGATSDYHSLLQASTTVSGGYFTLTDGVHYGGSGGAVKVQTGGTFRGGNDARLLAGTVTVAGGGGLGANGGLFTVESGDISFQDGAFIRGYGTLAATSDFKLSGQVTAEVTGADQLNLNARLSGAGGLSKTGSGTLVLGAVNIYTGATDIQAGTLTAGIANAFAQSGQVRVADGATLNLNGSDQIAKNLNGAGTITLGAAQLTVENSRATEFSGLIEGGGSLVKTGSVALTLSGANTYSGGTNINEGRLIITNGQALGTGTVTNDSELELALTADGTVANQLSGSGEVYKTGNATATLSADSAMGQMTVSEGRLALASAAHLTVSGKYIQTDQGILAVHLGQDDQPAITAGTAELAGALEVSGVDLASAGKASDLESNRRIVIQTTTDPIAGDFDRVDFNSSAYLPGYLVAGGQLSEDGFSYSVGVGLAWKASPDEAHGTFDLTRSGDVFEVDIVLSGREDLSPGNTWDGQTLTKTGLGTLILSRANTYTGTTDIQAGTLTTGAEDAFAQSGQVKVAGGATLNLNGFDQIAKNLSGAGTITLGSAQLTVDSSQATEFSGLIEGGGSLVKTGLSDLTLSGANTYSGGTNITEGRLIITNGQALGTGVVTMVTGSRLDLALTADGTVANQLSGSGAVYKTGDATVTLSAAGSSMGSLTLAEGGLSLTGGDVNVAGAYTQNADTNLTVTFGQGEPAITAGSASLAGTLSINGFSPQAAPASASDMIRDRLTVISSAADIEGDYDSVIFDASVGTPDYLTLGGQVSDDRKSYTVGLGLSWYAAPNAAHGNFTLAEAGDSFNVDVVLTDRDEIIPGWDGKSLTKMGEGNLILSAANSYTGTTDIQAGTLTTGIVDAFALSGEVKVADGATLNLNGYNQVAQNLSGAGNITLGSAQLTVDNSKATKFSGIISGGGSLVKTGDGYFTLSGENTYSGGTTISQGRLIIENAQALGTGTVINNGALELALAADGEVGNALAGFGTLIKSGDKTATLTGINSTAGDVLVNEGRLKLAQGVTLTADSLTTAAGATTDLRGGAVLNITGDFTQIDGSILNITVGNQPSVVAGSVTLGGALNIEGFGANVGRASDLDQQRYTIITSQNDIEGGFTSVDFGGVSSGADYLILDGRVDQDRRSYSVGFGLAWFATAPNVAHGTFTLPDLEDSFNVNVALADRDESIPGWDGKSLTKKGEGNLILSAANSYTGATDIQAGTLTTGIVNAFAASGAVTVASEATLNLNGYDQIAQNLSGAGDITLGSAQLTVDNSQATEFSGLIEGDGSLVKAGDGNFTLTGVNTYTGGTTINAGRLIITNAQALGGGLVTNNSTLELALIDDGVVANVLAGAGTLIKSGTTTATLAGAGSAAGDVLVNEGRLKLAQDVTLTAASLTTAAGATTDLRGGAVLNITGAFTQIDDSILNITVGNQPSVVAGSVTLGGSLNIEGFGADLGRASVMTPINRYVIITSNAIIEGDFASIDFGGVSSGADYLILDGQFGDNRHNYNVGFELAWLAALDVAHGTFTLPDLEDRFIVDVVLEDRTGTIPGWDGKSLTKAGDGELILSKENEYTGATEIQAGTLTTGIANAFAQSGQVLVNSEATLDLAGHNQTAQRLSDGDDGGGTIKLGTAVLTVDNGGGDSTFSGQITGSGSLVKTGSGNLTLSGKSDYSGGTTINAGRLIITNYEALGTGLVTNNGELELATGGTVANLLAGTGAVHKTGSATVTLSAAGSEMGSLNLEEGGLALTGDPGLTISGAYAQSADTNLIVTFGNAEPVITAGSASLAGTLSVNGFTSQAAPTSASALNDQRYTVIKSTDDIVTDFDSVIFDPTVSTPDYLVLDGRVSGDLKSYTVGLGLRWYAAPDAALGDFTLTGAGDSFNVDVVLEDRTETIPGWDGSSLTKKGDGNLILSKVNTYTGTTDIQAGILTAGTENVFAASGQVKVNSGAILDLAGHDQTARRLSDGDGGGGTINLGTATLTAHNDDVGDSTFSGQITGSGSLVKTGNGNLTLSGESDYSGGTIINAGRLIIENAQALGIGAVNNGSALELALTADGTVTNQLTGDGSLIKTGSATAILTGQNSSAGEVDVQAGALHLNQDGVFEAGAYATQSGADTIIGAGSQLKVTGQFTQEDGSNLSVYVGGPGPAVISENTQLGGNLSVMGLNTEGTAKASDLTDQHFIVVQSTNAIDGDFDGFQSDSMGNGADYLTVHGWLTDDLLAYMVGLDLAWNDDPDKAHGTFTLAKEGDTFDVDAVLGDRTGISNPEWDGTSLTKAGDGELILSKENEYTGTTDIQAGTLTAGAENAFAASGQVKVNSGATLNLNDLAQTAQRLSDGDDGGGTINLGTATLTASNGDGGDSTFSGQITGSGSLIKTGNGNLTLSGESDYSGGTTIEGGSLTIADGLALGSGTATVAGGAQLVLSLANDGEVANQLAGGGTLIKTGATTATLTSADTNADNLTVEVQEGVLSLAQNGAITVGDLTTARGATTELRPGAFLNVSGAFIQESDSILEVGLSNSPGAVISAGSVTLGGNLVIDGFNPDQARSSVITAGRRVIIESDEIISGDFDGVDFGGQTSGLDFLFLNGGIDAGGQTYSVGFELAWTSLDTDSAHGTFTLPETTIFEVDAQLNDRDDVTNPDWNGRDLTKNGPGTLILSKENGYTGATAVNGGLLSLTSDSALGQTSSLTIAAQAAVALNGTSQVVGRLNTVDESKLDFGGGLLTINENRREPGDDENSVIAGGSLFGGGGLILSPATVTVLGANSDFEGDVTVMDGSALILKNAAGLGVYGLVNLMREDDVLTFDLVSGEVERFSKILAGQGQLEIINGSAVALTGDNHDFTGSALVKNGMLIVGEDESPENILGAELVEVSAGGILSGLGRVIGRVNNAGTIQALNGLDGYEDVAAGNLSLGPLTNSGTIDLRGSSVGNTLTVSGGLTSDGGRLVLNTVLGGDDSLTDRLILDGGQTSGTTELVIINQGGQGGATRRGILVVSAVNGATTGADAFNLSASSSNYRSGTDTLTIGAYDYSLLRGGRGGEAESWYLVSGYDGELIARPEAGMLLAGREAARDMFRDSLYDRLMSYRPLSEGTRCGFGPGAVWGRVEGGRTRSYADNQNLKSSVDTLVFNLGLDLADWYAPDVGSFSAGLMFGLGRAEIDVESRAGRDYRADGDVKGYSVGLYGTWFQHQDRRDGFYADAWLKRSWFDHEIKGRGLPRESFNSRLWSASLEGGYSATIYRGEKATWSFDPSFQAIYHRASGGPAKNSGARVGGWADNSWTTRLGGRLHGRVETGSGAALSPYLEANWLYDSGQTRIFLDQDAVSSDRPRNTAEFKLGLAADWDGGLSAHIGLTTEFGPDNFRHVGGQAGLRYEW